MLSLGGHEYEAPKYSEWRNTFFNNSTEKFDFKTREILNCSLKKEDKIKLLKKLIDIADSKLKIIQNNESEG